MKATKRQSKPAADKHSRPAKKTEQDAARLREIQSDGLERRPQRSDEETIGRPLQLDEDPGRPIPVDDDDLRRPVQLEPDPLDRNATRAREGGAP